MKYNTNLCKRKIIRLKNYNYSSEGLYFITFSIKNKLCLLGKILNNNLELFESGKMIEKYWINLENKYENIKLHDYIVMPNHFHGIIEIIDEYKNDIRVNTRLTPTGGKFIYNKNSISSIIQGFKSITTNEYIKNVRNNNWIPFNIKLWQKNYYEHIIRDEKSYLQIVEYIKNNHLKWDDDKFYLTEI